MFVALRSDASDVGVGGYSMTTRSGRCIRRIQGSQYRKTTLTYNIFFGSNVVVVVMMIMSHLLLYVFCMASVVFFLGGFI